MALGRERGAGDRAQPLERVGDVRAELGHDHADRSAHRLILGLAQVDGDACRERALGHARVLAEVAAQGAAAQIEHDVVERAGGRVRQRPHAAERVLLGGEAPLPAEASAEGRGGCAVGSLQAPVVHARQREVQGRA